VLLPKVSPQRFTGILKLFFDFFLTFLVYAALMARSFSLSKLRTRTARRSIPSAEKPQACFATLSKGLALGYRKGLKGGTWIARRHEGGTKYSFEPLGIADDAAEGVGIPFEVAQEKARQWFKRRAAEVAGEIQTGRYSVGQAMEDYLADYQKRGGKDVVGARNTINAHILPALGSLELTKLTHTHVKQWFDNVTTGAPRLFTAKGGEQAFREIDSTDAGTMRKRKASANRILGVLRAGLNHAHIEGRVSSKAAWERVKPDKGVDVARLHFLSVDEAKRLIQACPGDFRRLVEGALYTGCRYGELTVMRVEAFRAETLLIPDGKSGKPRNVFLNDEGVEFFTNLADNRKRNQLMFTRTDGEKWNGGQKPLMDAAVKAAELPVGVTFHTLRHTHASLLAAKGVTELELARQLGHTSTQMTKRYSHFSDAHMQETAQRLPSFASEPLGAIVGTPSTPEADWGPPRRA